MLSQQGSFKTRDIRGNTLSEGKKLVKNNSISILNKNRNCELEAGQKRWQTGQKATENLAILISACKAS